MESNISFQKNTIKQGSGKLHWYHWAVVVASLALTISAWQITSKQVRQKTQIQFDYQAKQIIELVNERMEKYEQGLWSGVAKIHSSNIDINENTWQRFSQALSLEERYPGINGIGVILYQSEQSLPSYLQKQRQSRPDFNIHPAHNEKEFWPITYIEPVNINKKAVGLDMAHESNRHNAAKKTRDTGLAQITGPIILVQDSKRTPGFLFYAPFYTSIDTPTLIKQKKEQFVGLVYAPFIMEKLMEGTLKNKNRLVNFSITDSSQLLYDELHHDSENYDPNPLFSKNLTIEMYGRQWQFGLQSSNLFRRQQLNNQPLMILVGGIIIDIMLLGLFIVLARSNKSALRLAKKMTIEHQSSESRLNFTVDNMTDGLMTINADNNIISANKPLLKMFETSEEELKKYGTKILKAQHLNDCDEVSFIDVTQSDFIKKRHVINMLKMNGEAFPVEVTTSQAPVENGHYFVVILRDMSLKMATERALSVTQATWQAAITASPTAIALVDISGELVETNPALSRWLGYSELSLNGKLWLKLFPTIKRPKMNNALDRLFEKKETDIHIEQQFLRKDGSLVWGLLSSAVVENKNNEVIYVVLQIVDIQNERELLDNLKRQNIALEKSNNDLEQFAYIASHDLKSPLNAIQQLANWLAEDCQEILPPASQEHLSLLMGRASRMTRLLEDLLEYSKVNRFQFTNEKLSLKEVVDSQLELLNNPNDFRIECDDAIVMAPRTPLEIIIRNLLSNAIKHHDKSTGLIQVKITKNGQSYQLTISDNGPGIPPNVHGKVTEMFQTLKSRDDVEGSGMGLAMVKHIITHYKGELHIHSDGKRGTDIIIMWPLDITSERQE